jgi:hypothetical protein
VDEDARTCRLGTWADPAETGMLGIWRAPTVSAAGSKPWPPMVLVRIKSGFSVPILRIGSVEPVSPTYTAWADRLRVACSVRASSTALPCSLSTVKKGCMADQTLMSSLSSSVTCFRHFPVMPLPARLAEAISGRSWLP